MNKKIQFKLKGKELYELLESNNIHCFSKRTFHWIEMGGVEYQYHSEEENIRLFNKCSSICTSLFNDQLHICPRSSMIEYLKPGSIKKTDFIDLNEKSKDLKQKFKSFYSNTSSSPCQFCNLIKNRKKCLPAEQLS